MNSVSLIGRLTKDPETRYGSATQTRICRFSIAIDRGRSRNGEDRGTDYPNIVCFNRTAELCEQYLRKGRLVGVQGRLQTSSYEKDGRRVYVTEVLADRVEFLDRGDRDEQARPMAPSESRGYSSGSSSSTAQTGSRDYALGAAPAAGFDASGERGGYASQGESRGYAADSSSVPNFDIPDEQAPEVFTRITDEDIPF